MNESDDPDLQAGGPGLSIEEVKQRVAQSLKTSVDVWPTPPGYDPSVRHYANVCTFTDKDGKVHELKGLSLVSDVEVVPERSDGRLLPGFSFTARLHGAIGTFTYSIPLRTIRKWRRKKRMSLRRLRGRGAGSS